MIYFKYKESHNMKYSKGNKVILIGDGAVSSSYAFALVSQGIADELVIIDLDETIVHVDGADLNHSALYGGSPIKIIAGSYKDCSNADLIDIPAGAAQQPGVTRLD